METNALSNGQQGTTVKDDGLNEIRTRLDHVLKSKKIVQKDRGPFCTDFETLLTHEGQCAETERYLINGVQYGSMGVFVRYSVKKQRDPVDALNAVISGRTIQEFLWTKKLRFYSGILSLALTDQHYKSMFPVCAEKMAIISRGENGHLTKTSAGIIKSEIQYILKQKKVYYPDLKTIKIAKHAEDFGELIRAVIDELVADGKTEEKALISLAGWVGYQKKSIDKETTIKKKNLPVPKQNQTGVLQSTAMMPSAGLLKTESNQNCSADTKSAAQKMPAPTDVAMARKEINAAGQNETESLKPSGEKDTGGIKNIDEFHHALAMIDAYGTKVFADVLKLRKENDDGTLKLDRSQQRIKELEKENLNNSDILKQQQERTAELSGRIRELEGQVTEYKSQITALTKENADQKQYINQQKQTMSIYQVDTRNNSEEEKKALAAKLKPQYQDCKEIIDNEKQLSDVEEILVEIIEDIFEILKKSGIDAID